MLANECRIPFSLGEGEGEEGCVPKKTNKNKKIVAFLRCVFFVVFES